MINGKDNPAEWALLSYEIEEVMEHLRELLNLVAPESYVDEEEFNVRIGHVYAHLNRIWNSRNHIGKVSDQEFIEFTKFPTDIETKG